MAEVVVHDVAHSTPLLLHHLIQEHGKEGGLDLCLFDHLPLSFHLDSVYEWTIWSEWSMVLDEEFQ